MNFFFINFPIPSICGCTFPKRDFFAITIRNNHKRNVEIVATTAEPEHIPTWSSLLGLGVGAGPVLVVLLVQARLLLVPVEQRAQDGGKAVLGQGAHAVDQLHTGDTRGEGSHSGDALAKDTNDSLNNSL